MKILSVLCLVLAALFLGGAVISLAPVLVGRPPNAAAAIFSAFLGGGAMWAGARLWKRWRLPFGIIWIVMGVSNFANAPNMRRVAATTTGLQVEFFNKLADLLPIAGILLAILGVVLIIFETRRHKEERGARPSTNAGLS